MQRWPVLLLVCASAFAASPELQLTVIYDNTSIRGDLEADWGWSVLVEFHGQRVLFDAGAKPDVFLRNLGKLGIDKSSIQKTVISHQHSTRTGGFYRLLPAGFIYFLDSLSRSYPEAEAAGLTVTPVKDPVQLGSGIYSTGEIPGSPPEQALEIETSKGIVMLVSCAHPGIVRMVEAVEKQRGVRSIRLLIGGLHMYEQTVDQIRPVAVHLQKLNVQSVALGHCTGDVAFGIFRQVFGDRFSKTGAGRRIILD